ncbi:MAG: AgmX/PglI C-terminal domain-containing protein [Chitinispirillaceae bacterium]|nr:AgmX/PglI C-terminal domain-containing protein [Chitinispirillaceae bacterium]
MKNNTALIVSAVIIISAASSILIAAIKKQPSKKADTATIIELSESPPDEFRSSQNQKHSPHLETPQIMEMPQSFSSSQGELLTVSNGKKLVLPLLHTDVKGNIEGFTARVTVNQIYVNLFDSTIEALYTFPLPENAAVDSMILEIGDKRIKGMIKERQEARAIYEEARRRGNTTSLLEQQRPNIFTQSIANILPGDTIVITISYLQQLKYKNGKYLFNFPMVVGPRYIPGTPQCNEAVGKENPTDQVPDAHLITPPILPGDTRSGHDISLMVTIHKCFSFKELTSPSHRITISDMDSSKFVRISPNDQIPNKDFMLEYTIAGNEINTVFLTHKNDKSDGFFQLTMLPKINIDEHEIFPRELVFVVDNSGSMHGFPIEKCKELMKLSLGKMRRDDLFRVIKFAGSTEILSSDALAATDANIERAMEFVDNMYGGGGTEMMNAIKAIFDPPTEKGRKRLVLFMTDGYVGNEREIISTIQYRLGDNRVFSLGVGSSVNRYLLEGMAYAGRGNCMIIRQDGEAGKTIDEFYADIDAPVLSDLSLSWKGVHIIDPQPAQLPDLFQNQPLSINGKYSKGGKGTLTITGKCSGGRTWRRDIDVFLPTTNEANCFLPILWARKKIEVIDLLGSRIFGNNEVSDVPTKDTITKLGIEYRIITQYTSFVAVDDAVRNRSGKWTPIEQPTELPEGVSENSQPGYRFMAGGSDPRAILTRGSQCKMAASAAVYGLGGMKAGGGGSVGRKGVAGIGYGAGFGGSSSGCGTGEIDKLIGGLMNGEGSSLDIKKRGSITISAPEFLKGGMLTGGRSKASVMRVVMQNLAALRYAYNKRLRDKPGLSGKITCKFAIDEFGKVIFCQVVESTMHDPEFESLIVSKIRRWVLDKIDKPGDITEVVFPFVFSK